MVELMSDPGYLQVHALNHHIMLPLNSVSFTVKFAQEYILG